MVNIPKHIIVHHSITPRDLSADKTQGSINTTHKNRGFPKSALGWYIGYHYIIFGDGSVRQYRGDREVGAHCSQQGMNFNSIGVCLAGNFDNPSSTPLLKPETPSAAQMKALGQLLQQLSAKYNIPKERVVPHRKYAPKSCFGNVLPDTWAQDIMTNAIGDMILDRETAKVLVKRLYGFGGTGLLRRSEDPEVADAAAFNGRVDSLMGAGAKWPEDLARQANEITSSSEFIEVRVKITP